ncbi:MAG: PD-(D/E)XK nuclease family protein [bacterium]|nr:PD-(D/E)XK nuclease family protein [bacterium]
MTVDFFKAKYGYEIESVWLPRVTAVTSLVSKSFLFSNQGSADWGTLVHTTIERMLKKEAVEALPLIQPSLLAFSKWQKEYEVKIIDPYAHVEKRVYDMDAGYAGTVDMVAEVQGVVGVVDLKTSNGMQDAYFLQTAAYLNAYNKGVSKKEQGKTRWILRIDQYQECRGCFARKKEKDGTQRITKGKASCNHQWAGAKGEVEFQELTNQEKDLEAFLSAKEVWEWSHRDMLRKIANYPKNVIQKVLV